MKYFSDVITLNLTAEKCIGCRRCKEVCPHAVFSIENQKAKIVNFDNCMECGACAKNCPADAISVRAGVGCSVAVINGWLSGGEPDCDCC
ncbi:mercury methylation ferredoxin HgcB [Eubacteriaceae bacterium ES3]|nr:mercury methylation ferredoxin HgcB [Eubacteriaceae bacterium ES3]